MPELTPLEQVRHDAHALVDLVASIGRAVTGEPADLPNAQFNAGAAMAVVDRLARRADKALADERRAATARQRPGSELRHALDEALGKRYGSDITREHLLDKLVVAATPPRAPEVDHDAAAARSDLGLLDAPEVIRKDQWLEAVTVLGFDPRMVKRVVIDADVREIEVTSFIRLAPGTQDQIVVPAGGAVLIVRRYPFGGEHIALNRARRVLTTDDQARVDGSGA